MPSRATIDQVIQFARQLSALDKLKLIEQLAPDLEAAPIPQGVSDDSLDDQYQHGYETAPEDTSEVEALLPHLAVESEKWEARRIVRSRTAIQNPR